MRSGTAQFAGTRQDRSSGQQMRGRALARGSSVYRVVAGSPISSPGARHWRLEMRKVSTSMRTKANLLAGGS